MKLRPVFIFFLIHILLPIHTAFASIQSSEHPKNISPKITPINEDIFLNAGFELDKTSNKFRITGETNLPNDYHLFLSIRRKENGFFDFCNIHVKNGHFYSDLLVCLEKGKTRSSPSDFSPGFYNLHFIGSVPSQQTPKNQKIIGKNGEFLRGKLIENAYEDCEQCGLGNSVDFKIRIKLDGEESVESDNQIGTKLIAVYIAAAQKYPQFLKREKAAEINEVKACKQNALPGICYASIMHRMNIERCQQSYGIYKSEHNIDCSSESDGCQTIEHRKNNKNYNEKKLYRCLEDL